MPVCLKPAVPGCAPATPAARSPLPSLPPSSIPVREDCQGLGKCGLFRESMSNFPPVYEPLEPRWLPAACWSVGIHTPTGKGCERTGLLLWPPAEATWVEAAHPRPQDLRIPSWKALWGHPVQVPLPQVRKPGSREGRQLSRCHPVR